MTHLDPSQYPMTGLGRRFNPAKDLGKQAFQDEDLSLFELYMNRMRTGRAIIENTTFTRCRIEGPGIVLVLDGTSFDRTNFGESKGDIANLILRPTGKMAIGSIPVRNCTFVGCEFYMLGFTGNEQTVEQLLQIGKDL
jgi:hypothetical protein